MMAISKEEAHTGANPCTSIPAMNPAKCKLVELESRHINRPESTTPSSNVLYLSQMSAMSLLTPSVIIARCIPPMHFDWRFVTGSLLLFHVLQVDCFSHNTEWHNTLVEIYLGEYTHESFCTALQTLV